MVVVSVSENATTLTQLFQMLLLVKTLTTRDHGLRSTTASRDQLSDLRSRDLMVKKDKKLVLPLMTMKFLKRLKVSTFTSEIAQKTTRESVTPCVSLFAHLDGQILETNA
jgi:hypothetical protein